MLGVVLFVVFRASLIEEYVTGDGRSWAVMLGLVVFGLSGASLKGDALSGHW